MAANPCSAVLASTGAPCGGHRSHPIHSRTSQSRDRHPYLDARGAGGLRPQSGGRTAYLQSEAHVAAYADARAADVEGGKCLAHLAGAPGECSYDRVPHHVMGRGAAGGLKAAERDAVVVMVCGYFNSAVEADPLTRRWAERATFERNGVEYPFRMRTKARRDETLEVEL